MQDIPPREHLLSEWMPKDSFGMVYAPRGIGKSWFCMALGVAVSEGKKRFLGWDLHAQHDVLYVDGEMARVELKERFNGLCTSHNPRLHILPSELLYREGRPLSLDFEEEQRAVDDALLHLEEKGCRACLSPVKLCHNLIDTEDQNYGPQTSLRRGYFEAVARD